MARNRIPRGNLRSTSPLRHEASRADFDNYIGIAGIRRVGGYHNHRTPVEMECSRGHVFESKPPQMFARLEENRHDTLYTMCPDCLVDIKQILRTEEVRLSARQGGYDAEHYDGDWRLTCDTCGTMVETQALRHLDRHFACKGCDDETCTIWCADDGTASRSGDRTHAFLWVGREPAFIADLEDINVYPVFGEKIGRKFHIEADASPEMIAVIQIYEKELLSTARSKAAKMHRIGIEIMEKEFIILNNTNHMSWGDSPLTRAMRKDIVSDHFWDESPPVIQISEPTETPVEEPYKLDALDSRIPIPLQTHSQFLKDFESALAGDVDVAFRVGREWLTRGIHAEDRYAPEDSDVLWKYAYKAENKKTLAVPEGRWSSNRCHAILDAALAASTVLYGGKHNAKTNTKTYRDRLLEEPAQEKDPIQ